MTDKLAPDSRGKAAARAYFHLDAWRRLLLYVLLRDDPRPQRAI